MLVEGGLSFCVCVSVHRGEGAGYTVVLFPSALIPLSCAGVVVVVLAGGAVRV